MSRKQAKSRTVTYRTIEVNALDLARLLDWCDQSYVLPNVGAPVSIRDWEWYKSAYESVSLDFHRLVNRTM